LAGQGARRASAVGTAREQAQREAALLLELVP